MADDLSVTRSWWRWRLVEASTGAELYRLRGVRGARARVLQDRLAAWAQHRAEHRRLVGLRAEIEPEVTAVEAWYARFAVIARDHQGHRRWIPHDDVAALIADKPQARRLREIANHAQSARILSTRELEAVQALDADLQVERRKANDLAETELIERHRQLFDTVERSPLTAEQAKAVVCFDNRVQVVAAAGSGKTSVMVARAAYSIAAGLIPADRILLLAFNANAAAELQERVDARLGAKGIATAGLKAATFHSFGLSLIGQATGTKPRLAPWLDEQDGVPMISRIVDELRESSPSFRYRWDLYRLLFARTADSPEGAPAEWWDRDSDVAGHRTLRGETVRSQGEKLIADWLYLNGVRYEYERAYTHPVADAEHAQYRPDFYYPDIDVWHEHWALGKDGQPPAAFVGYADAMAWKRRVHAEHGTTLLETTWADIIDRSGFEPFERDLRAHGVELDWNPDRPTSGSRPVAHEELARLVRSFLGHVKSNGFVPQDLISRLEARSAGFSRYRSRLFLDLFWEVHGRWQSRLAEEDFVDYEDMLTRSAELLESGAARSAYDLVLVDEFQDSSAGRARMIRALTRGPGKYLLTVGDDWQSIYRFAGSDVSVMTNFESLFGPGEQRRLQTTFRSTQTITDVAAAFVSKNPRQIRKTVRSAQGSGGAPVRLATVTAKDPQRPEPEVTWAVERYLQRLSDQAASGQIEPSHGGAITVDVLGRYRADRQHVPQRRFEGLDVNFRTIHRAKGLEADYVLIPKLVDGAYGFPSRIESDPVLDLVIAKPDPFPYGEERRLLYVALTRARREVALVTVAGKESPFVVELLKDGLVVATGTDSGAAPRVCPQCAQGLLTLRTGKFGPFHACARFPACRHIQKP